MPVSVRPLQLFLHIFSQGCCQLDCFGRPFGDGLVVNDGLRHIHKICSGVFCKSDRQQCFLPVLPRYCLGDDIFAEYSGKVTGNIT